MCSASIFKLHAGLPKKKVPHHNVKLIIGACVPTNAEALNQKAPALSMP